MINCTETNKENIKVIVRIRPKIEREFDQGSYIKVDGNSIITTNKNESKHFTYDYIATEDSTQSEIFDQCARNIADSTLQGYNGTIFVYGQTGAGKTYTLLGPKFSGLVTNEDETTNNISNSINSNLNRFLLKKEEEGKGVLQRVIEYLFEKSKTFDNSTITFSCSFLEIYQEQISDLLDLNVNKHISIRDLSDSVVVEGLSKILVSSAEETLNLVNKGIKLRHVGSTNMNRESSRSHAVFSIYIENKTKQSAGKIKTKKSVFHLIDLAGSERQKMTEAFGERLKESGKINKSLMHLGHVIKSLLEVAEGKKCHIHYRDSKLTHLLKDSLGGNSKTCIIANISPANCNYNETISTLVFAKSAKLIKNKAVINEEYSNDTLYKEEIKKLREKYNSIKGENLYLLSIIEQNKQNEVMKIPSQKQDFSKTLDYVEEEMEIIVNEIVTKEEEIKILQNDNSFLKEKLQSIEIELKLKEKELREFKEISRSVNNEHEIIKSQLCEYVLKDAYMNQRLIESETLLNKKEFLLNKEIENLKYSIEENKRMIESKENIISSLNGDIKNYMVLITQRDIRINELKVEIDRKQEENDELKIKFFTQQNKEDTLINQLEYHRSMIDAKEAEVKMNEQKMNEFRQKGKNLVDQYDTKIENLKIKNSQLESENKKSKLDIRNLNILISELKKDRDAADEKSLQFTDEIKKNSLAIESLREENYKLLNDIRYIRTENVKLLEENELLSENKNHNSNKVSLLNKLKQENSLLKEENNSLKKNLDYIEKSFNIKNKNKINIGEYANIMGIKEDQLNECKKILHHSIQKINWVFENTHDDFSYTFTENMKNLFSGKTLEEKYGYYFDKCIKYLEYKQKIVINLEKELESKESKILSLNREIFLRNSDFDDEKENNLQSNTKTKKRHSTGSNIINSVLKSEISKSIFKTNNKRKYAEISNPLFMIPYNGNLNNGNYNMPIEENIIYKNNSNSVNGREDN